MNTLVKKLNLILHDIYSSIFEMKFIGIVDFESGLTIEMKKGNLKTHEGIISASLSEIGRFILSKKTSARNKAKRDALKDFKKLLIETEKIYIIISQIENSKFGLIAAIGKDGNLGLLLSKMKLASSELNEILS